MKHDWAREKVEQAVKVQYGYKQSSHLINNITYSLPYSLMVKLLRAERARMRRMVMMVSNGVKYEGKKEAVRLLKIGHYSACRDILDELRRRLR